MLHERFRCDMLNESNRLGRGREMTPSFVLDVRAAQMAATREYFSRSRSWDRRSSGNPDEFLWFVEDAVKSVSSAYWEIDSFARSIAHPQNGGVLNQKAISDINESAIALKATAEAALKYSSSVLESHGPVTDLTALEYLTMKCREAYQGAFSHWEPLTLPTRNQIRDWEAAGELIPLELILKEIENRLTPEERDELHRRVASTR